MLTNLLYLMLNIFLFICLFCIDAKDSLLLISVKKQQQKKTLTSQLISIKQENKKTPTENICKPTVYHIAWRHK